MFVLNVPYNQGVHDLGGSSTRAINVPCLAHASLCTQVVPELQELSLLRDSLKQLDDLFLVVVVGEFNSGKAQGLWLGVWVIGVGVGD